MGKYKMFPKVLVLASLVIALFLFGVMAAANTPVAVSAQEAAQGEEEGAETEATAPESGETEESGAEMQKLVEVFLAQLKAKYGEDYDTYYNAIIAEWGSVQDYLLSLVDGKDDPAANGWRAFVGWLGENAPIWGSALAIALVILLIVCGKAVLSKIMKWMNARKKDVYDGMNALSEAQIAQGKALMKLLGENPRTEEERAEIERTNAKLKGE